MLAHCDLHGRVRSEQLRGNLSLFVEEPQELQLLAPVDESVGPGCNAAPGGSAVSPQHGDQLGLHLVDVGREMPRRVSRAFRASWRPAVAASR